MKRKQHTRQPWAKDAETGVTQVRSKEYHGLLGTGFNLKGKKGPFLRAIRGSVALPTL